MVTEEMAKLRQLVDANRASLPASSGAGIDRGPQPARHGQEVQRGAGRQKNRRYFTHQTLRRLEARQIREARKGAVAAANLKKERVWAGRGCEVCGWLLEPGDWKSLHAHHVIPVKAGGTDCRDNLMVLCPNHHVAAHRSGTLRRGGSWDGPRTREDLLRFFARLELRQESA